MKNVFTTLAIFFCLACSAQENQKNQITSEQIDAVFSKWNIQDKAGIAVGVLKDGKVIYTKGYGLANLEHKVPINPNTKFYIGDLAKEFTVYAILVLEERGQLSLDDDIRIHLPKLALLKQPISINQLIHHTSGLNNNEVVKYLGGWDPESVFTKEQAYQMVFKQAKSMPVSGSVQWHTDAGFMILEDLIAKITKTTYEDFISKEIFTPLGMKHTVFDTEGTVIENKAQGYYTTNNKFTNAHLQHNQTILTDVYTTVGDMCLWANELFSPKIASENSIKKFDELSVVKGKKVTEMNTALYTGSHRFWNFRGVKKLYHIEVDGGYACKLIRYPDHNVALIVLGNDGVYNGNAATEASALYIEDFLDSVSHNSEKINSIKLSNKQLAAFESNYWDADYHTSRKIHLVNDTLRYYRGPGNESALVPLTKNSFKMMTWGEVKVDFDTTTKQKKMTVNVGGKTYNSVAYDASAKWTKDLNSFSGTYFAEDLSTNYTLCYTKGKLILEHPRLEPVELAPKIKDLFSGNHRHFGSLAFKRDDNNEIAGFYLSSSGVNPIWFKKVLVKNSNKIF